MRPVNEIQQETARPAPRKEPARSEAPVTNAAPVADDPRARAARRAAELRGHLGSLDEGVDKFWAPKAPDGWEYEWKRKTVMGWEDPSYMASLERTGWEPVPAYRHPELMPKGYTGSIERDGQILMERPAEISSEVRNLDQIRAQSQVKIKAGQMDPKGKGGIIGREDAQIAPKISKNYNMAIPEQ